MANIKGNVVVITGNGKGKTTSALGRCLEGWLKGKKVMILQFIKGEKSYGELKLPDMLGDTFGIKQTGLGFVRNSDHAIEQHRQNALKALDEARRLIKSNTYDILVLDEINYAVHFNLLTEEQVIETIDQKPDSLMIIMTGRYARDAIIGKSDEVYEFKEIKHYSSAGVLAREGIEY
ncbi:MAG: cob(I)yrinic acid a,c-diamide adenosyltransferase [Bacillota bacterium]